MGDSVSAARRAMLEATGRVPRTREFEGEWVTGEIREAIPTEVVLIRPDGDEC